MKFITLLMAFTAMPALACSGPGAGQAIQASYQIAVASMLVLATMLVYVSIRKKRKSILAYALMILFHPFWLFGVFTGDCGYAARYGSLLYLFFGLILFVANMLGLGQRSKD